MYFYFFFLAFRIPDPDLLTLYPDPSTAATIYSQNPKSHDVCFCFFFDSRFNLRQICPELMLRKQKSMNHTVNSHGTDPLTCVACCFRRVAGSAELIRLQIEGPLFQRSVPGGTRYGYEYEYVPRFQKHSVSFY